MKAPYFVIASILLAALALSVPMYEASETKPAPLPNVVEDSRAARILLDQGAVRVYKDSTGQINGVFRRQKSRDDK